MTTNLSEETYNSEQAEQLFKYSLYIGEGFIIAFLNALIVGTVIKSPVLRRKKEYMVVSGLALADVWNALGYFTAGCYRTYLILTGHDKDQVTAWDCMKTVHNFFFIVGEPLSAIFLTAVSLDRLIAVAVPLKYYKFDRDYGLKLSGVFYIYSILSAMVGVFLSWYSPRTAKYDRICFTSWAVDDKIYQAYYFLIRTIGSTASVVIYVFVYVIFRAHAKSRKTIGNEKSSRNQQQEKSQRRLMKTLGISSIFTFVFAVIPNIVMIVFSDQLSDDQWSALAPYTLSIANLNPLLNIFLYTVRHRDMRKGMISLILCRRALVADVTQGASSNKQQQATIKKASNTTQKQSVV